MEQIFTVALSVAIGNVLTGMLFIGMFRAFKIRGKEKVDGTTAVCLLLPLGFLGLGMIAFT